MSPNAPSHSEQFANQLARLKYPAVAFLTAMTLILAIPASQLRFDEAVESFFSSESPLLQEYLISKQAFGGDEFLIVGYAVDDPTSSETLDDMESFSATLSQIPGILPESMQDLASIMRNDRAPRWMRLAMRLPAFERSILRESRRMLISDDDRTVAIAMRLEDENKSTVSRAETFRLVREAVHQHNPEAVVAGEPLQVHDMFQYVETDSRTLGIASSLLLMVVILILFRNIRWVVLPIVLIQCTLIWTQGLLAFTGMKLSMVSSMLNSLVTIIGVATTMHITVTYRELRLTHSRKDSYRLTFKRLAGPISWTCITTAVGFAALLISRIVPVQSFAIMMTLATLLIPVLCCLLFPFGILVGQAQADPNPPIGEDRLVAILKSLSRWANRHALGLCLLTVSLFGLTFLGLLRLTVETDFSKNFREQSPIAQAIQYFENRMGGVGSWEIGFSAPETLTEETLDQVRELSTRLRDIELEDGTKLTKVISLTDGLDLVPRVPIDSSKRSRLLPIMRLRKSTLEEKREFLTTLQPEMESSLYNSSQQRMRIMLRALEQQPAEVKLKLIAEVEKVSREIFPDSTATGLYVLLANMISSLLNDQLFSFMIASAGVALTMGIAFRNLTIGLLSLIPNLLPILVLIGTMGLLGVPVNIGTAMIASVSMGLTVDSTIHYLSTYLRLRKSGVDHLAATESAHGQVGLALVLANLALVAGFSVLTMSNFVPLADFGILVSIAMLGGLVSNIFLMPVLLQWVRIEPTSTEPIPMKPAQIPA